jgi:hypothetical protein
VCERLLEHSSHHSVGEYRGRELEAGVTTIEYVTATVLHHTRIEVQDAPGTRLTAHRSSIVHFAGVDGDEAPRSSLDLPLAAPRRVTSAIDEADAVLIVRVARKGTSRGCAHRVDADDWKRMILD